MQHSEPADESQPSCAISGERFASFWHEASESWHYDDAKRLFGAEAARCAAWLVLVYRAEASHL